MPKNDELPQSILNKIKDITIESNKERKEEVPSEEEISSSDDTDDTNTARANQPNEFFIGNNFASTAYLLLLGLIIYSLIFPSE